MTLEDEEESGQPHELREIEPNTWSNGHLRWDPIKTNYSPRPSWLMRYATAPRVGGKVLGKIWWNVVWKEYIFRPGQNIVLAHDCLDDIANLLRVLNARKQTSSNHL